MNDKETDMGDIDFHDTVIRHCSRYVYREHVTFGLLYVMFTFPTRIFYRGVPRFATDCLIPWINHLLVHFLEI